MKEYFFAIGIIAYDKVFKEGTLFTSIENIKERVKGNYHIIIYNNCEEYYDELQNKSIYNVTILSNTYKHKNARHLYARKMIVEESYRINTDYTWLIDADDEVFGIDFNNLGNYTDVICLKVDSVKDMNFFNFENKTCDDNFLLQNLALWYKIIKTEIYIKIYNLIDAKNLEPISCGEDLIISLLLTKFNTTKSLYNKTSYKFLASNSDSDKISFTNIQESIVGLNEFCYLIDELFSDFEKNILNLNAIKYAIILNFLNRAKNNLQSFKYVVNYLNEDNFKFFICMHMYLKFKLFKLEDLYQMFDINLDES